MSLNSNTSTVPAVVDLTPLLGEQIFRSPQYFFSGFPSLRGADLFLPRANSSRRVMREPSVRVREVAAEQIEERQSDWSYSKPVVLLDLDMESTVVRGNGTETGQIIVISIGGRNGQPKKTMSYKEERVVAAGLSGVVYQAKCLESGESVAIKKVLLDRRDKDKDKDRELHIMPLLNHPNVVELKHYSRTGKNEEYLILVLEYVSKTVRDITVGKQSMPVFYVQLYTYQICLALKYLHSDIGVCHCDIKMENLLVNPDTHQLKLCDFGLANMPIQVERNILDNCSQCYRAPELIFKDPEHRTAIDDMQAVGCVMVGLFRGKPVVPDKRSVDELVEFIKDLGRPTIEEISSMNSNYSEFKFLTKVKAEEYSKIFHEGMPAEAVDLVSRLLQCSPTVPFTALEACAHPFFDDLRKPNACLPDGGGPLPPLFDFTRKELAGKSPEILQRLIPDHAKKQTCRK